MGELPDDTRLWAALQQASGGTWGGCVYDVDSVLKSLGMAKLPDFYDEDLEEALD